MATTNTNRTIAIVPLRAGSKGLPGKNVKILAGKPLYAHTIEHARKSGISEIVISTDIKDLITRDLGADVYVADRPAELSRDGTPMAEVLLHLLSTVIKGPATIALLQATSPLRDPQDISRAVRMLSESDYDLIMSVTPAKSSVLKWGTVHGERFSPISEPKFCFSNRTDLPQVFKPDGAVYVFEADWFRKNQTLETDNIGALITLPWRAHDIDTLEDFEIAEKTLTQVKLKNI